MPDSTQSLLESAAELGRRVTAGSSYTSLLDHATETICQQLHVPFSSSLELLPDGKAIFQAGVGWNGGVVGQSTRAIECRLSGSIVA